ncbi:hypothetical protein HAALTHF_15530n [Vreelandella aquamarina]|nr:hypothetical protein HAALTHF_15530n [Halomonas axialensis]
MATQHATDPRCQRWLAARAGTALCQQLSPAQIDYLEEPSATLADSITVADATGIDIALDETLQRGTAWAPHPGWPR